MGEQFIDNYSLLHFVVGFIFYLLNIDLNISIILHLIFELVENSKNGINILKQIPIWPGGKSKADTVVNSTSDTLFFTLGWIISYLIIGKLN